MNKNILYNQLNDKFKNLSLHCIVNECFLNALPLNHNEIEQEEKVALTKYSYKVLQQIGGFKALESAIVNPTKTDKQKSLLCDMYTVCTEASKEAATRIINEVENDDNSLASIVDKATFTDDEFKKFAAEANKGIPSEAISEIVKDKVVNVIKDEKEQYQKEQAMSEEISAIINDKPEDSTDISDTGIEDENTDLNDEASATDSLESYMDIVLSKSDVRHHVSVFSKLQDTAMEMLNVTPIGNNGTDLIPIIDKVTFEAFLTGLQISNNSVEKCLEGYADKVQEELCYASDCDKPKLASIVSIIVYTVVETMKTLHLYNPSISDVTSFVNKTTDANKVVIMSNDAIVNEVDSFVKDLSVTDASKMDNKKLTKNLERISTLEQAMVSHGLAESNTILMNRLNEIDSEITSVLNQRRLQQTQKPATESYFGSISRKSDVAQYDKIHLLYGRNPMVNEIRFKVDDQSPNSVIAVEALNVAGEAIKHSFINISSAIESAQYIDYLKDTFEQSKLSTCGKKSFLYMNSTGKKIELN